MMRLLKPAQYISRLANDEAVKTSSHGPNPSMPQGVVPQPLCFSISAPDWHQGHIPSAIQLFVFSGSVKTPTQLILNIQCCCLKWLPIITTPTPTPTSTSHCNPTSGPAHTLTLHTLMGNLTLTTWFEPLSTALTLSHKPHRSACICQQGPWPGP